MRGDANLQPQLIGLAHGVTRLNQAAEGTAGGSLRDPVLLECSELLAASCVACEQARSKSPPRFDFAVGLVCRLPHLIQHPRRCSPGHNRGGHDRHCSRGSGSHWACCGGLPRPVVSSELQLRSAALGSVSGPIHAARDERMAAQRPPWRPRVGPHPPQVSVQSGFTTNHSARRTSGTLGSPRGELGGQSVSDDARGARVLAMYRMVPPPRRSAGPPPVCRLGRGSTSRDPSQARVRPPSASGSQCCHLATTGGPSCVAFASARPNLIPPRRPRPSPPLIRFAVTCPA